MTIDELMTEAEKYNFGEGVPIDYEKAAFYYEQAAELGDMLAQYNLGLKYDRGTGVSKDSAKCQYWMQKSADQGYEPAKEYLALCEQIDLGLDVTISSHVLNGVIAIPYCDISNTALEEFQAALSESLEINFPTEKQLATRREIYRYLGYITCWKDSEKAYAYFQNGLPVSESASEDVIYAYLEFVNSMRGTSNYSIAFCQAVEDVYHNAFDKITDIDRRITIMRWTVREKCGTYKKPRDIAGAKEIQAIMLELAAAQEKGELTCEANIRRLCEDNRNSIRNAEHYMRQQDASSSNSSRSSSSYNFNYRYTSTKPKSLLRKLFPWKK